MRLLFYLFILSAPLTAQSPMLDPSFGNGGIVLTQYPGQQIIISSVEYDASGRILVAGVSSENNERDIFITRYTSAGKVDSTFGQDGVYALDINGNNEAITDLLVLADGSILALGHILYLSINDSDILMLRLNADGVLDTAFGQNGIFYFGDAQKVQIGRQMVLQPDGKIVVAGYDDYGVDGLVFRIEASGMLDSSFFQTGYRVIDLGQIESFETIVVAPDGKIVVAGRQYETDNDFLVIRFLPDGNFDPDFANQGIVVFDNNNGDDNGQVVLIYPNGDILLCGNSYFANTDVVLLKLKNNDGTPDPDFGLNGFVQFDIDNHLNAVLTAILRPDGSILIGGHYSTDPNAVTQIIFNQFNAIGASDLNFGTAGSFLLPLAEEQNITDMKSDVNGDVLFTGIYDFEAFSNAKILLAKLTNLPLSLPDVIKNGADDWSLYPNPSAGNITLLYAGEETIPASIQILDFTGRLLRYLPEMMFMPESGFSISLEGYLSGIYYVRVLTEGRPIASLTLTRF